MAPRKNRGNRCSYYVLVPVGEDRTQFVDVTAHLGSDQPIPVKSPLGACAMEVAGQTVVFSTMILSRRAGKEFAQKPIEFPTGVTHKLAKVGERLAGRASSDKAIMLIDDREEELDLIWDADGGVQVEGTGPQITIGKSAIRFDLVFRRPNSDRVIVVGFAGHLGAPGSTETPARAAGKALNSLMALGVFRTISGINRVTFPSRSQWNYTPYVVNNITREFFVALFDANNQPLEDGAGMLRVEVDGANADPRTGRLLYHFTPDERLAVRWDETYAGFFRTLVDMWFVRSLGGEAFVQDLVIAISLGEVTDKQVATISEVLGEIPARIMLSPNGWRADESPAA